MLRCEVERSVLQQDREQMWAACHGPGESHNKECGLLLCDIRYRPRGGIHQLLMLHHSREAVQPLASSCGTTQSEDHAHRKYRSDKNMSNYMWMMSAICVIAAS